MRRGFKAYLKQSEEVRIGLGRTVLTLCGVQSETWRHEFAGYKEVPEAALRRAIKNLSLSKAAGGGFARYARYDTDTTNRIDWQHGLTARFSIPPRKKGA